MVDSLLNLLFETSFLHGGRSLNLPSINTVKWANVDCDLTCLIASNVVHSTCNRKATHWLI